MTQRQQPKKSLFSLSTVLDFIERVGNFLPHPVSLFAGFALLTIILSGIVSMFDLSVIHPGTGETVRPVNLLSADGLRYVMTSLVRNFTNFAPLGTVLVALLGIGIAEGTGLLAAVLRLMVLSAPPRLLTFVIVFAGILSNAASEIGYVLLVPLAGIIFLAVGRNPLAGIAAAFAGVSGGYSANLVLGTIDPLLAGISQEAAHIIDESYLVNPACNYYFMVVSTFVVALVGTLITERLVEPRLGVYSGGEKPMPIEKLTPVERRGLRFALFATLGFVLVLLWFVLPENLAFLPLAGLCAILPRVVCCTLHFSQGSSQLFSSAELSRGSHTDLVQGRSGKTATSRRQWAKPCPLSALTLPWCSLPLNLSRSSMRRTWV